MVHSSNAAPFCFLTRFRHILDNITIHMNMVDWTSVLQSKWKSPRQLNDITFVGNLLLVSVFVLNWFFFFSLLRYFVYESFVYLFYNTQTRLHATQPYWVVTRHSQTPMHGNEICEQNHAIQIMIVLCEIEERILPTHTANDIQRSKHVRIRTCWNERKKQKLRPFMRNARGQISMTHRMAVSCLSVDVKWFDYLWAICDWIHFRMKSTPIYLIDALGVFGLIEMLSKV